jgi:Type III restriction enzyme, res subunit/Helicase conserved C-terminal domain
MEETEDLTYSIPSYPLYSDQKFYQKIHGKKEFWELNLLSKEKKEDEIKFLPHQELMGRLFSPLTLLNKVLLFHQLGVGKTCSSIAIAEMARKIKMNSRKTIILTPGPTSKKNFVKEVVRRCTNKYIPTFSVRESEPGELTEEEKQSLGNLRSSFRNMRRDFLMETHEIFAKLLKKTGEEEIISNYSNSVIIIDEVHHIRKEGKIYEIYHQFLHTVRNCKIILMTGTPMRDKAIEIVDTLNLLLPLDEQLLNTDVTNIVGPVIQNEKKMEAINIDEEKAKLFLNAIKGYVSYIKFPITDKVEAKEMTRGGYEDLSIYISEMSDLQKTAYSEIRKSIKKKESFRLDEQYASIFAYTKGDEILFGNGESFDIHLKLRKKSHTDLSRGNIKGLLKIDNDDYHKKIEKLQNYSCKFASVIGEILDAKNEKAFVFSYFLGQGVKLFSSVLNQFGFKEYTGKENIKDKPRLRYAIVTGEKRKNEEEPIPSRSEEEIMEHFNDPVNKYGEYIKVIIGSTVMSESISLKCVRQFHNLTTFWNNMELDQAIGRTIRYGSHNDLGDDERYVKICCHCAIDPDFPDESIDLYMYQKSFRKDKQIKYIEYLLKLGAVDCDLTKIRNARPQKFDMKRECEYQPCDYKCAEEGKIEDSVTYELYYGDKLVQEKIEELKNRFFEENVISFRDEKDPITIKALEKIVDGDIPVMTKQGFYCFLRKLVGNSIFYLVSPADPSSQYLFSLPLKFVPVEDYDVLVNSSLINYGIGKIPSECENISFFGELPLVPRLVFLEELYSMKKPTKHIKELRKKVENEFRVSRIENGFSINVNGTPTDMVKIGNKWIEKMKVPKAEGGEGEGVMTQEDKDQKYAGRNQEPDFRILGPKSKDSKSGLWKSMGMLCKHYKIPELIKIFIYLIEEEGVEYDISNVEIDQGIIENPSFNSEGLDLNTLTDEMKKKLTKFIGSEKMKKVELCKRLENLFNQLREQKLKKSI